MIGLSLGILEHSYETIPAITKTTFQSNRLQDGIRTIRLAYKETTNMARCPVIACYCVYLQSELDLKELQMFIS
jgi:hypothetical protein